MLKRLVLIFTLLLAIPCFAQSVDLALGFGHTWTGAGNYLYGTDHRALNLQLDAKWTAKNGLGGYAGYTQDAFKLVTWLNDHRFTDYDTSKLNRLKSLDLGACYVLRGDRLNGWIAAGASGYDALGDTAMGWFVATGADLKLYKSLFLQVKAEYRSHCTEFIPMQASAFETGLLVGWKF
jgi:hypothetical protein